MSGAWLLVLAGCLALSAILSGSEVAFYRSSRTRVAAEALRGGGLQVLSHRLVRNESLLLSSLLVGNTLVNQLSAVAVDGLLERLSIPVAWHELLTATLLTPVLVLFGELFPKDLARRRPHHLLRIAAPVLAFVRVVVSPLAWPLACISGAISALLGGRSDGFRYVHARERVFELLRERGGHGLPEIERLALNTLDLRARQVEFVMVPWRKVETLRLDRGREGAFEQFSTTAYSRLPVIDGRGHVAGYLHQLEFLREPPETPLAGLVRPLIALDPATPLDRALSRLRQSGQRAALVGSPEKPAGWVTLKDLVEEVTGELSRW
ncbi:MAG: DUF21 domain-containing protein [Planctomycetes bacterium]|nr:DUF21 domain-containing protein [Planctomycetota bacterium]